MNVDDSIVSNHGDGINSVVGSQKFDTNMLNSSFSVDNHNDNKENIPNNLFKYNNHNESIYDDARVFPSLNCGVANDDIVKFDTEDSTLINHATIKALIVQLTSPDIIDYNLICDFFLTYRSFVAAPEVLDLLLIRLIWSLQYCSSNNDKNVTMGKLVLLRTFVVLRHWIINYFVDDFLDNHALCDHFITTLNDLIESHLIVEDETLPSVTATDTNDKQSHISQNSRRNSGSGDSSPTKSFESKIISNLKIHWLSLINDFSQLNLDIDMLIDSGQVLNYKIPLMSQLPVTNIAKESSIHTNPSYRRSAMLSLYDKQIHKCLIYDDKSSTENPQYSINNLLLQHLSSRISLQNKLNEFKSSPKLMASTKMSRFNNSLNNSNKANTDVSTSKKESARPNHNHLNLKDNSWQIKNRSKPTTDPVSPQDSQNRLTNTGFSTNGNIKLPSSKVNHILPSTPVKKMEDYGINCNTNTNTTTTGSPKKTPHSHDFSTRKKSVKKFISSWKKPHDKDHEKTAPLPKSASDNSIVSENEKFTRLLNSTVQIMDEDENAKIGNRVDILSARIIDELEYLIRHYIKPSSPSTIVETENANTNAHDHISTESVNPENEDDEFIQNNSFEGNAIVDELPESLQNDSRGIRRSTELGSPVRKLRHTSQNYKKLHTDRLISEEININDLSDLNIGKIDSLINKEDRPLTSPEKRQILPDNLFSDSSFQRPTSINWNEDIDLDNTSPSNSNEVTEETYENEYDVEDMEPNSLRLDSEIQSDLIFNNADENKENSKRMVKSSTQYFDVSSVLPDEQVRFNRESQTFESSSISTPSNITQYDEEIADLDIALSPQSLKKQTRRISIRRSSLASCFRQDSMKSYISYDSAFSVSNVNASQQMEDYDTGLRKKNGFNNLRSLAAINNRKSIDFGLDIKSNSIHSFVSRSSSIRRSVRFSTLCALTELPFNDADEEVRSAELSEVLDSSAFSITMKSKKSSMRKSVDNCVLSSTSSNSVAIPGISNYVLKELAAIPDESYHSQNDPVQFALSKLEGKDSKSSMRVGKVDLDENLNKDGQESDFMIDDTQAILSEINNAKTDDCVSLSQLDMTQVAPLTPVKKNTGLEFNTTPTFQDFEALRNPKVILDNYIANDLLKIERVMKSDSHISFLLSYNSKTIADHLTIIEKDMLQEVDWKELIELKWNRDLTPVNSWLEIIVNDNYFNQNKGVNLVIARFNLMVNWIISEILLTKYQRERIAIISRFIHIAQNCYSLQNFSTVMQIILALTSEKVLKLKETWKNLAPGDILMLKNLEELASPLKNFLNMRICINKMKPSKGCIPFVGLYLSDLVFNAERPTFIKLKANTTNQPASFSDTSGPNDTESSSASSDNGSDKIINFSKFRTAVHIVKSLSQCIEWSSNYKVTANQELLSKCLYVKSLDEEEMNYCISHSIDG